MRNRKLGGYKFRRQRAIGPIIADFYCADCRLVIEIDGGIHLQQITADRERSDQLLAYGYTVIRFSNQVIENQFEVVLRTILQMCKNLSGPNSLLPELGEGLGDEGSS